MANECHVIELTNDFKGRNVSHGLKVVTDGHAMAPWMVFELASAPPRVNDGWLTGKQKILCQQHFSVLVIPAKKCLHQYVLSHSSFLCLFASACFLHCCDGWSGPDLYISLNLARFRLGTGRNARWSALHLWLLYCFHELRTPSVSATSRHGRRIVSGLQSRTRISKAQSRRQVYYAAHLSMAAASGRL